jgi:hypothetical protein
LRQWNAAGNRMPTYQWKHRPIRGHTLRVLPTSCQFLIVRTDQDQSVSGNLPRPSGLRPRDARCHSPPGDSEGMDGRGMGRSKTARARECGNQHQHIQRSRQRNNVRAGMRTYANRTQRSRRTNDHERSGYINRIEWNHPASCQAGRHRTDTPPNRITKLAVR